MLNRIDRLASRVERAHAAEAADAVRLDLKLLHTQANTAAELRSKVRVLLTDLGKESGASLSTWVAELADSVAADAWALAARSV